MQVHGKRQAGDAAADDGDVHDDTFVSLDLVHQDIAAAPPVKDG
jgi:hypothetical protein